MIPTAVDGYYTLFDHEANRSIHPIIDYVEQEISVDYVYPSGVSNP
jgi:hypothetical protein